jgi:hypothetical protein
MIFALVLAVLHDPMFYFLCWVSCMAGAVILLVDNDATPLH